MGGGGRTDHPDPENTDLGPKLAFFGHFWVKNGVFCVVADVKHLLNGFNGMQHNLFGMQHPQ